jgi:hypothetical protein
MQQQLNEVAKALLEAKRIAIISHKNPDGDTLGSQLALGGALKELGKDVVLYNKDKVASKFNFIAGADQVVQYHDGMELPETVVFVDCAEPQLAGFTVEDDVLMGKTIINIDHHFERNNKVVRAAYEDATVVFIVGHRLDIGRVVHGNALERAAVFKCPRHQWGRQFFRQRDFRQATAARKRTDADACHLVVAERGRHRYFAACPCRNHRIPAVVQLGLAIHDAVCPCELAVVVGTVVRHVRTANDP